MDQRADRLGHVSARTALSHQFGDAFGSKYCRRGRATIGDDIEWCASRKQLCSGGDGARHAAQRLRRAEPNDIGIYARDDYYFDYHNPKFNEVIAALDKETDQAKRLELLGQAQKILADDAVNGFLFELPKVGVWDAKLKGMWTNWPIFANDLSEVHWED